METKQRLLRLIKLAHGIVDRPDLEKHRQSQDQIGELIGRVKDLTFQNFDLEGMNCEWVSLNRAHVKKQVILHCHGGGYSTG
ncbi:MAG: alpha/beta hydrolase, partial [Lachnospiraceae bacterium]|nr:alpha/beta hydrolase [Lachnospiraceae bacterium]